MSRAPSGPDDARTAVTVGSEVALAAVTLSVVLGLGRLFANGSFLPSLIVIALAAHLSAALVRRSRLTGMAAAAVAVGAGLLVVVWVRYWSTTVLGVPTLTSLHHAGHDLTQAWHQFGQVVAPAPVTPGFVLAAAIAIWGTAWFADWAAFRLGAVVEATLPAAAIFLFASMLGADRFRVLASLAFVAAVLAFVLLHRSDHRARASAWIGSGARDGARSMVALGGGLLAAALVIGAVAGPNLPGSRSDPAVDWRGDHGQQATRITVSPLVDIRKRLVQQSNVQVFTVISSQRSYWRLTSLDSFDGSVWSSSGRFGRVNGSLPETASTAKTTPIVQRFNITGLAQIWLPAAFRAKAISPIHGTKVRWDGGSDTLIVDTGTATSDHLAYTVTSEQPDLTRAELDRSSGPVPGAIKKQYLGLPATFPTLVSALARQVTSTGQNPYQKALLLQDYFRKNFTYDLTDTPAGHSDQAIEAFLASKRGYCEQFAGTYAAMARAIGLPSRVAVGFTPGATDPTDPNRYIVEGRYAHAWPEVWLNQAGWVPFEPTPGRGIPGAESYTGVADQQASAGGGAATTPTTIPVSSPATQPRPNPQATTPKPNLRTVTPTAPTGHRSSTIGGLQWGLIALALALLAVLAWAGGLAAVRVARRERRRRAATSAARRVEVAWIEGVEAVARVAPGRTMAETKQEFAERRRPSIGAAAQPLDQLADLATAAQWSAVAIADDEAAEAADLSHAVNVEVRGQISAGQRLRQALLPRSVRRP